MNKILFADLDGTLLDDKKEISEKNRKAIQKLLEDGNYFVICTGRPVASGRIVARELGLTSPGCYMICFNGAVIYDCSSDRVLVKNSINISHVTRLFEEAKKAGLHIQTYNDTDIISLEHTKELDYYKERSNMSHKIVANLYDGLMEEPQKVLLVETEDPTKLERFKQAQAAWTDIHMNSFFSCEEYLEYCPKDIDKGSGVRELMRFLNIPCENTFAVGDERNDIAMLKAAGMGFAMKNSHEAVLEIAEHVTKDDNNHDAIAEIIEEYIL